MCSIPIWAPRRVQRCWRARSTAAPVKRSAPCCGPPMRGFTARSDRLPGDRMIALLNALFDAQAKAIRDHGGEILKCIGDGLLAIFAIETAGADAEAAGHALKAAVEALAAVSRLGDALVATGEPPLEIVMALHGGTAIYGNIAAADRLDFTVIGPAVNLVSRIEAVAKTLNLPIVVSGEFARAYGGPLRSLGSHQLRGLSTPHELFAPVVTGRSRRKRADKNSRRTRDPEARNRGGGRTSNPNLGGCPSHH